MAKFGPCPYIKEPGSSFCARHGHNSNSYLKEKRENVRNYQLTKYQARINQFADNPQIKSLREEIGILRMSLETILEQCNNQLDLILYSSKITDLVMKINVVVNSCHKLENANSYLLDKGSIMHLMDKVFTCLQDYIDDDEFADVSEQVALLITEYAKPDEQTI